MFAFLFVCIKWCRKILPFIISCCSLIEQNSQTNKKNRQQINRDNNETSNSDPIKGIPVSQSQSHVTYQWYR